MSGSVQAARRRARTVVSELVSEVLAGCERDGETRTYALEAIAGARGALTVEDLAEFADRLDYELVIIAQPLGDRG